MSAPTKSRRRIVVGVDGSPASVEALQAAAKLAPVLDAELDAVIAWHYPAATAMAPMLAEFDPAADSTTVIRATVAKVFGDDLPTGLREQRRQGYAAGVLLDASVGAEMLVVGSRGHGSFAGLLLDSVSAYCTAHAPCPIPVTRTAAADAGRTSSPR